MEAKAANTLSKRLGLMLSAFTAVVIAYNILSALLAHSRSFVLDSIGVLHVFILSESIALAIGGRHGAIWRVIIYNVIYIGSALLVSLKPGLSEGLLGYIGGLDSSIGFLLRLASVFIYAIVSIVLAAKVLARRGENDGP